VSERPLFTGSVEHSLDDKGRLVVPSRFREKLGPGFFLTIVERDKCLALYPAGAWAEISAKLEEAPIKDAEFASFVRHVYAHTDEVSCDTQGRIGIAPNLRAFAGIGKDVVSIGTLKRVEVWAKERYDAHLHERGTLRDFTTELGLF
jgi:transcriptional regulator MraZ